MEGHRHHLFNRHENTREKEQWSLELHHTFVCIYGNLMLSTLQYQMFTLHQLDGHVETYRWMDNGQHLNE